MTRVSWKFATINKKEFNKLKRFNLNYRWFVYLFKQKKYYTDIKLYKKIRLLKKNLFLLYPQYRPNTIVSMLHICVYMRNFFGFRRYFGIFSRRVTKRYRFYGTNCLVGHHFGEFGYTRTLKPFRYKVDEKKREKLQKDIQKARKRSAHTLRERMRLQNKIETKLEAKKKETKRKGATFHKSSF
jgi:hypothetical protein